MDKKREIENTVDNWFNKTINMFHYTNLPDTIPENQLEYMLQNNGFVVFTNKLGGEYYVFNGSLMGQDVYNNPTHVLISNVVLGSAELELKEECVLIKNDYLKKGLVPLFDKYSEMIVETDLSIILANYNTRIQTLISANDDNTNESAKQYLESIVDGKLGVISESKLIDSLKVHSKSVNGENITNLIELEQYLKASLLNEIGLNANFNMKRERLNSSEVEMNTDNLYPLIDNMLQSRKEAVAEINEKYGLEIEVEFTSIWIMKQLELENAKKELEELEESEEVTEESEEVTEEESEEPEETEEPEEDTEEESEEEPEEEPEEESEEEEPEKDTEEESEEDKKKK